MPTTYDPNDPSTWGPVVGTDANGKSVYANQPGASAPVNAPPVIPGPSTTAGKSGPAPIGSNPPPVTVTPDTAAGTGKGYAPDGTVSDPPSTKSPLENGGITDPAEWSKSLSHPVAFAKDVLGMGDDGSAEKQTQLAKDVTAPSSADANSLYAAAIQQAASANAIKTPLAIQAPDVSAPIVTGPQTKDSAAYIDRSNTQAEAYDATGAMRGYAASLARAADPTGQQVRADTTMAQGIAHATVGDVGTTVAAPTIGPASQTSGVTVEKTNLDPLANQLRGDQIAAAKKISDAPSAAMSQFKAGIGQVASDQLAVAARARGAERAGARREAMINIGAGGATQNLQAAALSAQEEQAKRVAAAAALTGIRSQDVTSATAAASINAERAKLQAQLDTAIAQGNTQAVNTLKSQQATLELQAAQSTVQAGLTQQGTKAGLAQANMTADEQTALANATAANKQAADYAAAVNAAASQKSTQDTSVSATNAAATTKAAADYAAATNAAGQNFAAAQTATSAQNVATAESQARANADRALTADTSGQQMTQAAKTATANNALAAATSTANNNLAAQTTTAGNQLSADQLRQQGATAAINAGTGAVGVESKNAQTIVDANKSGSDAAAKKDASLIGAGGSIIGAAVSDVRAKTDVEKITPAEMADLAKHMDAFTYRYKPGYEDGGQEIHGGQLAQELEKSALGSKFVHTRPDGIKEVDKMSLASVMAASAAQSLRRKEGARA